MSLSLNQIRIKQMMEISHKLFSVLTIIMLSKHMQSQIKTYCIIGDPIQYSLSPAMQNSAFNSLGLNCTYIAFRVPKGELELSISSLQSINIAGFNVTIPHKVEVINHVDALTPLLRRLQQQILLIMLKESSRLIIRMSMVLLSRYISEM